ncbi:MAG: enoyl-CoA hydratase/isomerase family protein [Candidatus Thermoplasmatota archaeon]|nr:enoyl-CoA hydratase/isomerase family protein [Candidatus Thermoplasmatota archaeon]MBS3817797.1 enoyl-CoA hydratase/isomerase family protein [Candidatus Thermoplasmatota archaeon]
MIEIERKDHVTIIELNNPPVNAVCNELLDELDEKLDKVENDESRAVIMTGKGKAFVGGADIKEMKGMGPKEAKEFSQKGQSVFNRIENFPKPVIAAVNGFALGGGTEIAMSCDFIIASEKAQFGQPEVGLGLIPGFGGTQRLARLIGMGPAKELIFTGKRIDAEEAERLGLANHVVEADELMDFSHEIAEEISSNGPLAVRYAKSSMNEGIKVPLDEGLKIESKQFKRCFKTEDHEEGLDAFIEKREPEFKGE